MPVKRRKKRRGARNVSYRRAQTRRKGARSRRGSHMGLFAQRVLLRLGKHGAAAARNRDPPPPGGEAFPAAIVCPRPSERAHLLPCLLPTSRLSRPRFCRSVQRTTGEHTGRRLPVLLARHAGQRLRYRVPPRSANKCSLLRYPENGYSVDRELIQAISNGRALHGLSGEDTLALRWENVCLAITSVGRLFRRHLSRSQAT